MSGGLAPNCQPVRLGAIEALGTAAGLEPIFGPVAAVGRASLDGPGKSGAALERLDVRLRSGRRLRLVVKRDRLDADWKVAAWSGDTAGGREAALLGEPALAAVWAVFACPYRAYAAEAGAVGLLMEDLGAYLVPAAEAPIAAAHEDAVLGALAALHARFWDGAALELPWLAAPATILGILRPETAEEVLRAGPSAMHELYEWVRRGWAVLRARAPAPVAALLARPDDAFARACAGLPRTLLHGDARLVNFAFLPDGRVAAFDWQLAGAGPATLDLGYYLIGNARRRAHPAEAVIARYRGFLEARQGRALPEALWDRMLAAGVLFGAAMLLWDRALDLDEGLPGADVEWDWWIGQLTRWE